MMLLGLEREDESMSPSSSSGKWTACARKLVSLPFLACRSSCDLLAAVAVYAAGGRNALLALGAGQHSGARLLLPQLRS
jgi:hypothetical protein